MHALADRAFDRDALERELEALRGRLRLRGERARWMQCAAGSLVDPLDATPGETLQQRWMAVEDELWTVWEAGERRLEPERQWTWGPAALVLCRAVRPGWTLLSRARLSQWLGWLPDDDPLNVELGWLRERIAKIEWAGQEVRRRGHLLGIRILLHRGYDTAAQITDGDLATVPGRVSTGLDALDAVQCAEGVLARSPSNFDWTDLAHNGFETAAAPAERRDAVVGHASDAELLDEAVDLARRDAVDVGHHTPNATVCLPGPRCRPILGRHVLRKAARSFRELA